MENRTVIGARVGDSNCGKMAEDEKELQFTVVFRGKPLQLKALGGSSLGDLGKEIVELTGVAPRTLRLILPKRPPIQPMSEKDGAKLLYQSGITEVFWYFFPFSKPKSPLPSCPLLTCGRLAVGSPVCMTLGLTGSQIPREIIDEDPWECKWG